MIDRLKLDWRLARLCMLAELRGSGLRLFAVGGALAAAIYAWNQGQAAGTAGVLTTAWMSRVYGVVACLWFAYYAVRDQGEGLGAAVRATPLDGGHRALASWAAGVLVWACLVAVAFVAAALAQAPAAGFPSFASAAWGFARVACTVTIAGTLSYALSRLMRSPLGGVIVMFAWFCAMAGMKYVPRHLQPEYEQNRLLYISAAALSLCLVAVALERFRRGELRRKAGVVGATVALAAMTTGGAVWALQHNPAPDDRPPHLWARISEQHLELGQRAPGFWLPDGRGGIVRTAPYEGRVLLIYLFAADDASSGQVLNDLDRIVKEHGSKVQPIAICLSPDQGDAAALSRTGGHRFAVVGDPSTVRTTAPPHSAVAIAYAAENLPLLVVTDRRRLVREFVPVVMPNLAGLRTLVEQRLAAPE